MDRRCDQFPNCVDFSDEEKLFLDTLNTRPQIFLKYSSDIFTGYDSGKLPAAGEGGQLPPRLHTIRRWPTGQFD